jgi:cell division protein FtsI (penicillin-binding protein 3)
MVRARSGRRLSWLLVGYLFLTALMGYRLVSVQVLDAAELRERAERQTQREITLPARRGRLYDRSGEPLAMSLAAATLYANPRAIAEGGADPGIVASKLAPLLDRDPNELLELLTRDASFVYLGRQLPHAVGEQVRSMRLAGIGVLDEPTRRYPSPGLAAQVVGFSGVDHTGLAGLELAYEDLLEGDPGRLLLERAPGGLTINGVPQEVVPPRAGTDLVLTIDRQIQWQAERALAEAVERYGALGGSAVVLEVATGEILAMASAPSFDPTDLSSSDDYARRNRAVTDIFEPGSVSKVITTAAALEEGFVTADDVFTVADTIVIGPKRFKDSHPHPTEQMTVSRIMAESSNVGTIQIAQRVGEQRLHDYLVEFGFGRATGLGFPGESRGLLPAVDDWWVTSLPTISIGQGVSATLLQVAGVFETVASGGTWREPTLVRGTVDEAGRLQPAPEREQRRVVSEETARTLADMLTGVVTEGTGGLAAVPGYSVAGKTGTAQKPSETERGYKEGAYIATFAGFAPAEDPALVVAVMLDEPTPIYGGLTAAPVFSEIMGFALGHQRVVPTAPEERATAAPVAGVDEGGDEAGDEGSEVTGESPHDRALRQVAAAAAQPDPDPVAEPRVLPSGAPEG